MCKEIPEEMHPAAGFDTPRVLLANAGARDGDHVLALLKSVKPIQVIAAISAEDAVSAELERPDCILLDGEVDRESGNLAAIPQLRSKWNQQAPAVIVLGEQDSSQAAMARLISVRSSSPVRTARGK